MFYDLNLSNIDVFQSFVCITILTLAIIYTIKWRFSLQSKKDLKMNSIIQNENRTARSRTKYPEVDAFKYSKVLLKYGLFVALVFSFSVISWTTLEKSTIVYIEPDIDNEFEIVPPITSFPKPPLPVLPPPIISEVIDISNETEYKLELLEEDIIENIENGNVDSDIMTETITTTNNDRAPKMELPKEENLPEEIVDFADEMPRYPGCESELLKKDKIECSQKQMLAYIYDNLKYPVIARDNGVEGICVISFVVTKTGKIKNIELLRDIGAGCGKNSLNAIQKMSLLEEKWIPGKQRGRPVNVRYRLPIKFKLKN